MKKYSMLIFGLLLCVCDSNKDMQPTDNWIGLITKQNERIEKTFKAAGRGKGIVHWWAGGYTYRNGSFSLELIDAKSEKRLLYKYYQYGDKSTGSAETPKFHWWHSEESGQVTLKGGRVYRMILRTEGLAEPGAGWGMWLYEIGTATGNPNAPK